MRRAALFLAVAVAAGSLFMRAGKCADPLTEPHTAAVIAAVEAADGLSALSEIDFFVMQRDRNRKYFDQEAVDGGTLMEGRKALRKKVDTAVQAMGDVQGKYAELAHWTRELWYLADEESALVTGTGPVDDAMVERMKDLKRKTQIVRDKMRPHLPEGVSISEPDPEVAF